MSDYYGTPVLTTKRGETMSIQLKDIAYGRVSAPDLDVMQGFLQDFGMQVSARTPDALYLRGHGPAHHIHVVHRGAPGVRSLAFDAATQQDLERAAQLPGASPITPLQDPGGGQCVLLSEPNGLCIEVVYGRQTLEPLPVQTHAMNTAQTPRQRPSGMTVMPPRPAQVVRFGHGVIFTPQVKQTAQWFQDTFGMLQSDLLYDGSQDNVVGIFLRMAHGSTLVDHHTMFVAYAAEPGIHHLSFEVADIDDLLRGKEYLAQRQYQHLWGISRHVQGGQISDYWVDPSGVMLEHWTDSDRLDENEPPRLLTREQSRSFWGPQAGTAFRSHRLSPIAANPAQGGR